jgi:hypothetical protein
MEGAYMTQVLDYSAGYPGAQAILDAGYSGAVRYIGFPDRPKCTTAGELTDFDAHGAGMALVFENTTTDWRGGYGTGQASGRRARDHANNIGFPDNRPIYMAIDQDVVTSGEFNVMLDYLRGASASLGGTQMTGVYGEADVIDRARDAGAAAWYWQTVAWSRGRRTAAHLFQHVGTVFVGGVGCDVNDVLVPDWGQHNAQEEDVSWDQILPFNAPDGQQYNYSAADWLLYTNWFANMIPGINAKLDAVAGALTDTEANIIAAIRGKSGKTDVANLSTQLAAVLGPDTAAELGRRLTS